MADSPLPVRRSGDILLILPPFAAVNRPSLGLAILQQIAAGQGLACEIYYATLHLAQSLGESLYIAVSEKHNLDLLGERLFSSYAFPSIAFEEPIDIAGLELEAPWFRHRMSHGVESRFHELERAVGEWLKEFRALIGQLEFRVFGLSTMFSQNLCCACLARIIKEEKPDSSVIIGGANCDGDMARGLAELSADFDHIFIGEAEESFRNFCQNLRSDALPAPRLVAGRPAADLDRLPCPDYHSYFSQLSFFLPHSGLAARNQIVIPYETSRGCWWGQKHHCTFCGLNPGGMASRIKDGGKALADLRHLRRAHGRRLIDMTDNIMPMSYFKTLLPAIIEEDLDLDIFYEQKSNLNFQQLRMLKAAGINSIQPGIEAFSSSLLQRMRKGVTGAQNIRLLRDCRSLGISTSWNLLFNFPGDADADYERALSLIRSLWHLSPPMGFLPVYFDRFSPYFREPEAFGIKSLRPIGAYSMAYPSHLAIERLAYHFIGDADVVEKRNPALVKRLSDEVQAWIAAWQSRKPLLNVSRFPSGEYVVYDTRHEGNPAVQVVDRKMATLIVGEARAISQDVERAMEQSWVIEIDGTYLGLAVAAESDLIDLRGLDDRPQSREPANDLEASAIP